MRILAKYFVKFTMVANGETINHSRDFDTIKSAKDFASLETITKAHLYKREYNYIHLNSGINRGISEIFIRDLKQ